MQNSVGKRKQAQSGWHTHSECPLQSPMQNNKAQLKQMNEEQLRQRDRDRDRESE